MQHAQRDAVLDHCRPTVGVPANVRGLHPDHRAVEQRLEPADRAAILVGPEDLLAEAGRPGLALGSALRCEVESGSFSDLVLQRLGKVLLENRPAEFGDQHGTTLQEPLDRLGKATLEMQLARQRDEGRMAATSSRVLAARNLPQAISLQMPEGIEGVRCLARRAETFEQRLETRLGLDEVGQPRCSGLDPPQRVKQQQRLVWRSSLAPLPGAQVRNRLADPALEVRRRSGGHAPKDRAPLSSKAAKVSS